MFNVRQAMRRSNSFRLGNLVAFEQVAETSKDPLTSMAARSLAITAKGDPNRSSQMRDAFAIAIVEKVVSN